VEVLLLRSLLVSGLRYCLEIALKESSFGCVAVGGTHARSTNDSTGPTDRACRIDVGPLRDDTSHALIALIAFLLSVAFVVKELNFTMKSFIFVSLLSTCAAWTTSSAASSFQGSVLITQPRPSSDSCNLVMKKGKPNVPPNMRGQYKKQKEMAAMQKEMMESQKPGSDGLPVFNLFVRTKKANVS